MGSTINMSEGFGFSILLVDGEGVDSEGKHWTGEKLEIGEDVFKHNTRSEFEETPEIARLFDDNPGVWKPRHKRVLRAFHDYRRMWLREFRHKAQTLSYQFHYHIYNSSYVPYANLIAYLREYEQNELLQRLDVTHGAGLRLLYERLRFFDAHPCNALWFTFWHDVWKNNSVFGAFEDAEESLAPANSPAIAYHPLDQEDLEVLLRDVGVKSYFSGRILDKLYTRMDEVANSRDAHNCLLAPFDFYRSALVDALDVEDVSEFPPSGSGSSGGADDYTYVSNSDASTYEEESSDSDSDEDEDEDEDEEDSDSDEYEEDSDYEDYDYGDEEEEDEDYDDDDVSPYHYGGTGSSSSSLSSPSSTTSATGTE